MKFGVGVLLAKMCVGWGVGPPTWEPLQQAPTSASNGCQLCARWQWNAPSSTGSAGGTAAITVQRHAGSKSAAAAAATATAAAARLAPAACVEYISCSSRASSGAHHQTKVLKGQSIAGVPSLPSLGAMLVCLINRAQPPIHIAPNSMQSVLMSC